MNIQKGILLPTEAELRECELVQAERIRARIVGETPEQTRRLWLEGRRKSIGASDIPSITGSSKYTGPFRLWHEKKGNIPIDEEEQVRQRAGHAMEPLTAKCIMEVHPHVGVMADPKGVGIAHSFHAWNVASLDRILFAKGVKCFDITKEPLWIPVELKNVSAWAAREWDENEVPLMYYEQVQNQLEVSGRPCAILAATIDGNPYGNVYTVWRDYHCIDRIMPAAEYFWNSLKDDTPPYLPSERGSDREALKIIYPHANALPNDAKAPLSAEAVLLAARKTRADDQINRLDKLKKVLEKERDLSANQLMEMLKDIAAATGGGFNVFWKEQEYSKTDKEAREADEELARLQLEVEKRKSLYVSKSTQRILRITRPKKG